MLSKRECYSNEYVQCIHHRVNLIQLSKLWWDKWRRDREVEWKRSYLKFRAALSTNIFDGILSQPVSILKNSERKFISLTQWPWKLQTHINRAKFYTHSQLRADCEVVSNCTQAIVTCFSRPCSSSLFPSKRFLTKLFSCMYWLN